MISFISTVKKGTQQRNRDMKNVGQMYEDLSSKEGY